MITSRFRNIGFPVFAFIWMSFSLPGPAPQQDIYKSIESAIAIGSADQLAEFLNSSVELELPGSEEDIYSKSQAVIVLRKFFDGHPPESFNITNTGNAGAGLRIAIGNYMTTDHVSYRVKIFLKKVDAQYLIQEIEFE